MARRALRISKERFWLVVCILHPEMTRGEFEHMWDENYRKRRPQ